MAAVASSLLAPLLTEPARDLEILGSATDLAWLKLNGQTLTVQLSKSRSRLSLPTSIFLPPGTSLVSGFMIHEDQLWLNGAPLEIARWWYPGRALVAPWTGAFGLVPEIPALLGAGQGLTPEGDDVLAGWLVMARSIQHPSFEAVRDEVLEAAATRTSTFSAALLDCAAKGFGVSPLIDYVTAHISNRHASMFRRQLERVGHTSGSALAHGVDLAIGLDVEQVDFSGFNKHERLITQ